MKLGVYSVYDEKACFYSPPFCAKTDAEAIRMFDSATKDSGSSIAMYPADYSLYFVGRFLDESALIESVTPVFLSRGSEHFKSFQPIPETLEKSG